MAMWLPECLRWPFCPGVFIAILAFTAAAVTFRKDPRSRERAVWIFLFLGLMSAEVWMMSKDRTAHDIAEGASRKTEQAHFNQTIERLTDLQKLYIASNQAQVQVAKNVHLPEVSLKKRAADLSAKIFRFLTDRKVNEPLTPLPKTREDMAAQFDALVRYSNQTMALYKETFQSKVVAIHDEFARQGIRSDQLDQFYQSPVNDFGIEYTASAIGALAERLNQ